MCGIFLTTRPTDFSADSLRRIADKLRHRGPDAAETVVTAEVAAVHTRLAVIGLGEEGRQPVTNAEQDVLVFNGELYNFREFDLATGAAHKSDTQLLFRLAEAQAWHQLSDVRGMFAFAHWNSSTRTLTAIRDPFGIKPLFLLTHPTGGVTLSSELGPLLEHPDSQEVDGLGVAQFLAEGHTGPTSTILRRVTKLQPGIRYQWRFGSRATPVLTTSPLPAPTLPTLSIDQALTESVRDHMTADIEVGTFMSSGVDSTLITALASRISPDLRAYTIAFPDSPSIDESQLARANASTLGVRHTVVPVSASDLVAEALYLMEATVEPLGDPAVLPVSILSRHTKATTSVVLAGEGADEVFGGYRRYSIDRFVARNPVTPLPDAICRALDRRRPSTRPWRAMRAIAWGRSRGFQSHSCLLEGGYGPLLRSQVTAFHDALVRSEEAWNCVPTTRGRGRAEAYDLHVWLPNTYLEKTDRATMAAGLEARVPFLDARVVLAAQQSPPRDSLKTPLRQLLGRLAPEVQLPRAKKGLAVDFAGLLSAGLRAHAERETKSSDSVVGTALGPEAQRVLQRVTTTDPHIAFRLAQLGLWHATSSGQLK
jgi:asparagine synthase (glutamine-hydrolysing)